MRKFILMLAVCFLLLYTCQVNAAGGEDARYLPIEYDDIVTGGDQYILCSKMESSFSAAGLRYGVYDWLANEWLMEYQGLPTGGAYLYVGDGMFIYTPDIDGTGDYAVLINAPENEIYEIEAFRFCDWNKLWFDGFYAVGTATWEDEGQDIYVFDKYGEYWSLGVWEEYDDEWDRILFSDTMHVAFLAEPSDEPCIVIKNMQGDTLCVIDDHDYTSRYESFFSEAKIAVTDDFVFLLNMEGEDGLNYSAVFNMDGNAVLPATQCKDSYVSERGNLMFVSGDDAEEITFQDADAECIALRDMPALISSDAVYRLDGAADIYGKLHPEIIAYGKVFNLEENPDPYELEETLYLGGLYDTLEGTVFVERGLDSSMSCVLWIVGDGDKVLYRSEEITNTTKPYDIRVDVSGVTKLQIGYSGYLYDMNPVQTIMLSEAYLYPADQVPEYGGGFDEAFDEYEEFSGNDNEWSEPDGQMQESSDQLNDSQPVLLSSLFSYEGELPHEHGTATDNMGNSYTECFFMHGGDQSAVYDIGGEYSLLTATIAVTKARINEYWPNDYYAELQIWGGNKLLYENLLLSTETKPFDLDLDITGVKNLKIRMKGMETTLDYQDGLYLIMANATLRRGNDQSEQTHETPDESNVIEPVLLSFKHSYVGDLDKNKGAVKDNMGNTYTECFLGYPWSEAAVYDIGGKYSRLTATIAVTKAEVAEALYEEEDYASMRIWGDDMLLYENAMLGLYTKPFELNLDIKGVVDLKIEIIGVDTNFNLTNGLYLIMADTMLEP